MSKHTPGPWHVYMGDQRNSIWWPMRTVCAQEGDEKFVVANCNYFTPERAEANARLIAAAPALLEALKAAQRLAASGPSPAPADDPRWAQIADAIAAAEGR